MSQKIIVTVAQGQGKADLLEQIELNAVQGRPPMRLAVKPGQRIALQIKPDAQPEGSTQGGKPGKPPRVRQFIVDFPHLAGTGSI